MNNLKDQINRELQDIHFDTEAFLLLAKNSQEGRERRRTAAYRRAAAILAVILCCGGAGAYAAVNHFQERGSQLSEAEKETYAEDLMQSPANADTFSRELTDSERERREILMDRYLQEGLYPARKLLRIQTTEEIVADRVCFLPETSTFYLPERELTDEDLLEIIDHDLMTDYSLAEARKEEQKQHEATQEQQNATQEQQAAQKQQAMQDSAASTQGQGQGEPESQGKYSEKQKGEELSLDEAIAYAKNTVERVYGENTEHMEVTAEQDNYTVEGMDEPYSDAMIYLTKDDASTQYYVCVDLIRKEVNVLKLLDNQNNYAQNCIEPGNLLEEEFLKDMGETACRFAGEDICVQKGHLQIITDQDGYLANGVVTYYFEIDNGRIIEVSYSKVTKQIYSLWNVSLDSFKEEVKNTKLLYEKDGYTYQFTEFN